MNRVFLLSSYFDSVVRFRGELVKSLVSKGLEVNVVSPNIDFSGRDAAYLRSLGVVLHSVKMNRTGTNFFLDFFYFWQLFFLFLRLRPSMVLAYTVKPVCYGLLAARLSGVPARVALITGLGYVFQECESIKRSLIKSVVILLYRLALRGARVVFFQNTDDRDTFRSLNILHESANSCVVAGSGVDVAYFSNSPLFSETRFLLIARLLGDKGVREYVSAARAIRPVHPDVSFSLVGWIDENPDAITKNELDLWSSEGVVEYLGKLSDVRQAINRCSVYVLPSYREGTPRSVLEAMAMGRAIITTDAPGCRETVVDGDNGFLVPVKSVDALVEAMKRFIEDPELAVRMGQRSREIAVEKYDVHKVNAVMLKEMGIQ
tara:strand:+ start:7073 stop:8197 length:1125 start_codon:yes stop_codon:yes gene_type:complete